MDRQRVFQSWAPYGRWQQLKDQGAPLAGAADGRTGAFYEADFSKTAVGPPLALTACKTTSGHGRASQWGEKGHALGKSGKCG